MAMPMFVCFLEGAIEALDAVDAQGHPLVADSSIDVVLDPIASLCEWSCVVTPMAAAGTEPMQQNHRGSFGIPEHAPVTAISLPDPYRAFAPIGTVGGRLKSSCLHVPDGVERSLSRRDGVGADRGW